MIDDLATVLVHRCLGSGRAALVSDLAVPLAVGVLCRVAGLPPSDHARFGPWVRRAHRIDGGAEAGLRMVEAIEAMDRYQQVQRDPRLTGPVVEECLRQVSPFPQLEARYAAEPVELGGVVLARATRSPSPPTRREAQAALRAVIRGFDDLRLGCTPEELVWEPGLTPTLRTLPVRFTPRSVPDGPEAGRARLLFGAGLLAGTGRIDVPVAVLAASAWLGAVLGDCLGYGIGRGVGRPWVARYRRSWSRRFVEAAERRYARHGWFAVVVCRWFPGVRAVVPTLAGVGRMHVVACTLANGLGALLWAVGMVVIGRTTAAVPWVHDLANWAMAVSIAVTVGYGLRPALRRPRGARPGVYRARSVGAVMSSSRCGRVHVIRPSGGISPTRTAPTDR